jgi:hypothetical protein
MNDDNVLSKIPGEFLGAAGYALPEASRSDHATQRACSNCRTAHARRSCSSDFVAKRPVDALVLDPGQRGDYRRREP